MRNSWKAGHKNTRTQKTLRMGFASVGMTRKFRVKSEEWRSFDRLRMTRKQIGITRVGVRWEIII